MSTPVAVTIETENVPSDWDVVLRIVRVRVKTSTVSRRFRGGSLALSTWTTDVTIPEGFSAMQVRASAP